MNNPVLSFICGAVNFMPPWIMLGVFGAIVLLVVVFMLFKGFKRSIKFIILGLILMAGAYLVYLAVQIALWESTVEKITFAISWGPTILFVLIVMTATFVNAKRGLRKSLILALHAVCAGALCVAFFFICTSVKEVDTGLLSFINLFAGEGGLQRFLGVSEEIKGFKEVLVAALPQLVGTESDFGILISSNSAYLYTLVDMVFKLIFAVLAFCIYFPLIFILYIVYLCCYSQRKYKRTKIAEFKNGMTDRNYRKHHLGGGAVGMVRGIAAGLLCLSFLGSAFFIVAGGKGDGKLDDYDYGDDNVNEIFSVYRSIESYGAQGIFKILNALTDAADTPYYLFAADLIFSGELNDEEAGISQDVKFREEFGAFTGFARDTFSLLMKYGEDELKSVINGEAGEGAFDKVLDVMAKPGFRQEFDELIDDFDSQTYVINFSLSLVNTIVNNIDKISLTSSMGEDEKELIQLLFKKGYLSASIPDERKLIAEGGLKQGDDPRPYLNVSRLIEKKDVKIALNVALSLIAEENATDDTMKLVKRILPEVSNLSLLSDGRKGEVDPVLGRLYCLVENKYLTSEGQDGVCYDDIAAENIDWVGEINALIDVSDDVIDLYTNISNDGKEGADILLYMFDEENPDCEENVRLYDNVCLAVTDSKILGKVLASSYIYDTLYGALKGVSEDVYLSKNINYSNTYDKDGNLVSYGETYQLLYGIKLLADPENKEIMNKLLEEADSSNISELLELMSKAMETTDKDGKNIAHYLTESEILRSVLSVSLIDAGSQGNTFYVPKASCERDEDGNTIALINKPELSQLLENMDELVNFVMVFMNDGSTGDGEEDKDWSEVDGLLQKDSTFYKLVVENRIFEGTVAQILNEQLRQSGALIVPAALATDINGWVTVDGRQGELIRLLDALRESGFEVSGILTGGSVENSSIFNKVLNMTEDKLESLLSSSVLHYTVSNYILDGTNGNFGELKIVVPLTAQQTLKDDVILSLVRKSELISAFGELNKLGITENTEEISFSDILIKLVDDKSLLDGSKIISASLVATIINKDKAEGILSLPASLQRAGSEEELKYYDAKNVWHDELKNLLTALDELLGISKNDNEEEKFEFSETKLTDAISDLLKNLDALADTDEQKVKSKLDVCYGSIIFKNKLTVKLDEALLNSDGGKELVPASVLESAKDGDYYKLEELHSLSDAITVFEVEDILNVDTDALIENVKSKVPDMNVPLTEEEYGGKFTGKSTLEVVYPSKIISYLISDQLDTAFDENALIDDGVLFKIKDYDKVYKQEVISAFIDAVKELGFTSLDGINGFGYDTIFSLNDNSVTPGHEDESKLDVIYGSDLAAGIITKAVKNKISGNSVLCDHPYAYREDLAVYNKSEIESVISVIEQVENADGGTEVDMNKINFAKVGECVYDKDGKTSSYLIVASVSEQMLASSALIIPPKAVETVEGKDYISAKEIMHVCNVFGAYGTNDVKDWEDVTLTIPEDSVRENIYQSEIMRARIIFQLVRDESTGDVTHLNLSVAEENAEIFKDASKHEGLAGKPRITVTSQSEQLEALVDALVVLNGGESADGSGIEFAIPDFESPETLNALKNMSEDDLVTIFKSDILRYEICRVVLPLLAADVVAGNVTVVTEDTVSLRKNGATEEFDKGITATADAREVHAALQRIII